MSEINNGMKIENNIMLLLMLSPRLNKSLLMLLKTKDLSYKQTLNKLCLLKFLKFLLNTPNNTIKDNHGMPSLKL